MYGLFFVLVLFSCNQQYGFEDVKEEYGPFILPNWELNSYIDYGQEIPIWISEFQAELHVTMISSRAWRMTVNWHPLLWYSSSENSYVNDVHEEHAEEWVKKRQCKVGLDFESSYDSECWEDLDKIKKERWIYETKLEMSPPSSSIKSVCSLYWSCDIHDLSFPVYASTNFLKDGLYIMSPKGKKIRVDGGSVMKVHKVEDSILAFKPISFNLSESESKAKCLYSNIRDDYSCILNYKGKTFPIIFSDENYFSINNLVFKIDPGFKEDIRGHSTKKLRQIEENTGVGASMSDLKILKNFLLVENEELVHHVNILNIELAEIKNVLSILLTSISKIDDHLIGKIINLPVHSKWIDSNTFVLIGSDKLLIEMAKKELYSKNCRGSYVFQGGRWKYNFFNRKVNCTKWNKISPLPILKTNLQALIEIKDFPSFRNSTESYDGWSFLDDGRISLDSLDSRVKFSNSSFFDSFGSILNWYGLSHLGFTAIFIIIVSVIFFCCLCKRL